MKVLVLSGAEVRAILPMETCISVMEAALSGLARGAYDQPLRRIYKPPGAQGLLGLMPAFRRDTGAGSAFGLKAVGVFPENAARGVDTHQGAVLLFRGDTGELLALMDGSAITEIRTAAVSAVATRLLAREDATELAIVGSGVQARSHLEAMSCVRSLRRARVASRTSEHARAFATAMSSRVPFPIEPVASVEAAVRDADIVVTATSAAAPVLERSWIADGAHLNLMGSSSPRAREADTETMRAGALFVDRRESCLNEAGDYLMAAREGALRPEDIRGEIGEVLTGGAPGRTSATEITIFKSLGLGVEDLAAAEHLHREAIARGAGSWLDF